MSKQICVRCGKEYTAPPALSRVDNKTHICPLCGTAEALEYVGADENTKAEILKAVQKANEEFDDGR